MTVPDLSDRSLSELISLTGRPAVVTGGAKGLGRAIARRLAEAGAPVLIGDVDLPGAHAAAAEISALTGVEVLACELDATSSKSVIAAADLAVESFGSLGIWVNNAGIYPMTPVLEMSDDEWDRVMDLNLRGVFIGCREAARKMVAGSGGVIINISSIAGYRGSGAGVPHYVASKHAVRGLTRQMALEFAPHNVRVLCVAPTRIVTPGLQQAMSGQLADADIDFSAKLVGPLGRAGVPDDVARVVLFCASDLSGFMTGSTLLADGGELA